MQPNFRPTMLWNNPTRHATPNHVERLRQLRKIGQVVGAGRKRTGERVEMSCNQRCEKHMLGQQTHCLLPPAQSNVPTAAYHFYATARSPALSPKQRRPGRPGPLQNPTSQRHTQRHSPQRIDAHPNPLLGILTAIPS